MMDHRLPWAGSPWALSLLIGTALVSACAGPSVPTYPAAQGVE